MSSWSFLYSVVGWPPFAHVTPLMCHGMEAVNLWHCVGVMEAVFFYSYLQVLYTVGSDVSHLPLDDSSQIFWVQVRRVCWAIKQSDTMVVKPAFGTFGRVGSYQVLLENKICISIQLVKRGHGFLGKMDFRKHNGPTGQNDMAPKSITLETSGLMDSAPLGSFSRLLKLYMSLISK